MNTATISGKDFLDILFNGRNKDYGAYDLRRKYDRRVRNAIIGTASVTMVIIGGYALNNNVLASETVIRKPEPVPICILPIEPIEAKPTPPPPALPSSTPPPVKPSVKFLPPVIARNEEVSPEDVPPRMRELENKSVGVTTTTTGDETGIDVGLVPETSSGDILIAPKERDDRDKPWVTVEIMPSFPGGEAGLAKYLSGSIRYPHIAVENGIEGIVVVQFVVDYEGNIKDVKVLSAAKGGGLEQEASRVIKAMPKWKPGRQNGRNVSVLYSIPVNFRLSN